MENRDFFAYNVGDVLLIKDTEGQFFTGFLKKIEIKTDCIWIALTSYLKKIGENEYEYGDNILEECVVNFVKITRLRVLSTVDSIGDYTGGKQ